MTNISELEQAFLELAPLYTALGQRVEDALKIGIREAGIKDAIVSSRTKDVASFLKKSLRVTYGDPMNDITDKVGVRVVVSHIADLPMVEAVIAAEFQVHERVDKADDLADDQLGYLGIHYLVVGDERLSDNVFDTTGYICEIQIHTRAQNAWATVSHPLMYKAHGTGPSSDVRRRINRLVALVELFDQEVDAARSQAMQDQESPELAMLDAIEQPFLRLVGRPFDTTLSLKILHVLREAFTGDELQNFAAIMRTFTDEQGQYFAGRVEHEMESDSVDPLLTQPEALVVLERLSHARLRLRAAWDSQLEPRLLDRLAESLGRPLQSA